MNMILLQKMEWFSGKKVFITGGSSGIGKATALRLVSAGADVCIASRGLDRLEGALAEIRGMSIRSGQRLLALPLDVTDVKQCHATAEKAVSALDGIDVLINNAGASWPGYLERIPDAVWDRLMSVNYMGTVNCTRAFLRVQRVRGQQVRGGGILREHTPGSAPVRHPDLRLLPAGHGHPPARGGEPDQARRDEDTRGPHQTHFR
jgi:NAD(P)-dependent dehydrogenase (short-subunit alcohol dehydrogenase family)